MDAPPCSPPPPLLYRLSTYLEELEAMELKKFKLYVGNMADLGEDRIPWGRMEMAGPLEMAQLLVRHAGPSKAWLLALGVFQRIPRKDLWERGRREDPERVPLPGGPSSPGSRSMCLMEVCPGAPREDPREAYRAYVRRKFRLMEDRNARLGECVNLSHRYTRLLLVKGPSSPTRAQPRLADPGRGLPRAAAPPASPIQVEALFEPDEERPEPPLTVVLQGAAGMGKSMLARKAMLDWADGRLFRGRFDYVFYVDCRELSQGPAAQSARDLLAGCWPEPGAPLRQLLRAPERLLLIVDGFDELGPATCAPPPAAAGLRWDERRPPALLLGSLLRRALLPRLALLVTTRPSALGALQALLEHPRHVELHGFAGGAREEYFGRFFRGPEPAGRALAFVRDREPLFTLCRVPLVCWIVCTCLQQQLAAGGLRAGPPRTTTAVYLLYLRSLLPPAPPRCAGRRGLCSLAAHGLWSRQLLFHERELRAHSLEGADVSAFLNVHVFQKDIGCEQLYSFLHLSFQEFFAAMFYVLGGGDPAPGSGSAVTRLLDEYGFSDRSFLALPVRFLCGLLSAELRGYLEDSLGWEVSPRVRDDVLGWIRRRAGSQGTTLRHGALELFSCLYEIQDEDFIREALGHFQVVVVSDVATTMDHVVCAFCVRSCPSAVVLHLNGAACRGDQEEGTPGTSGAHHLPTPLPDRNALPDTYSEHLAATLCTNTHLVELALSRSALGDRGVRLLCQGLRHPSCRLQNLRLKRCGVSSLACQELAAALVANQNLLRMDVSGNSLGPEGVALLCEGLRHPRCRLQMLQLRRCRLEAGACREVASVLSTSQHLEELDLTGNAVGDEGLRLLGEGLRHPDCKLRTLWLKICHLTAAACGDLASVLSVNRSLTELDLGLNELGDPGVLLLCEGLQHPACQLQTLRLSICRLGPAACDALSAGLQGSAGLWELDLSFNDLGDAGLQLLGAGLRHPACKLRKLWLDSCGLTAKACEDLSTTLGASQSLTELYLTNNALGDVGVRLLCRRLRQSSCKLRVLWLFGMDLNKGTHRRLAALRGTKPHLDIGC
ncbi:NACHT, LRR and PYD domains-containing protein 12 [Ctenodactylus gundi]